MVYSALTFGSYEGAIGFTAQAFDPSGFGVPEQLLFLCEIRQFPQCTRRLWEHLAAVGCFVDSIPLTKSMHENVPRFPGLRQQNWGIL